MPMVLEKEARRVAAERMNNADCLWTAVAEPYGDRVTLTLPSAFRGRQVQILFFPVSGSGEAVADGTSKMRDEMSSALAALPGKYAVGNWNGYGEKPLNEASYGFASEFAGHLPAAFRGADVGVDADGEVTLEWYRSRDCQCSLTFAASGNVYCVVRKDGDKVTAMIASKAAGKIIDLIGDVVNA